MNKIQGTPSRPGPEADLVQEFVQTVLPTPRKGWGRYIFIEPELEMSRPDIVVVYWDLSTPTTWSKARLLLNGYDLRIAQLLFMGGPLSEASLKKAFPKNLYDSLYRLEKAELINQSNGLWCLRNISEVFAVCHIVTFEAKISSFSRALEQAFRNTWFASESYILTAKDPSPRITKRARQQGLGIWSLSGKNVSKPLIIAEEHQIPKSYASWFFNELVWKISLGVE